MNSTKSYIAYWACLIISAVWYATNPGTTVPHTLVGTVFLVIAIAFQFGYHYHEDKEKADKSAQG